MAAAIRMLKKRQARKAEAKRRTNAQAGSTNGISEIVRNVTEDWERNEKNSVDDPVNQLNNALSAAFKTMDADGDGNLSVQELAVNAPRSAANALMQSDGSPGPPKIYWKYQLQVYRFYNTLLIQSIVAAIIAANFFVTIAEKELDAYPREQQRTPELWKALDTAFNLLFLAELLLNMAGSWFFSYFWRSPWNVFDFIVVVVGILSMSGALEGSPLSDLKTLRFFRVFRLFKRVPALNKIVTALIKAIPGVLHAFMIMLIVMCCYAIFGVEYFSGHGDYITEQVVELNEDGSEIISAANVSATTGRNMMYGNEYFGSFSRAIFTLFQVLTGESWAEMIARPLLLGSNPRIAVGPALYFASFILVTQVVLVNVVIAVLLDKFVTEPTKPAEATGSGDGPAPRAPAMPGVMAAATVDGATALAAEMGGMKDDLESIERQMDEVIALKQKIEAVVSTASSKRS